jgi:hypothetical protein
MRCDLKNGQATIGKFDDLAGDGPWDALTLERDLCGQSGGVARSHRERL